MYAEAARLDEIYALNSPVEARRDIQKMHENVTGGKAPKSGASMLNSCANPECAKPLHYLREGRIFVFDAVRTAGQEDGLKAHRMEHYWLCGDCSQSLALERTVNGVRVVDRSRFRIRRIDEMQAPKPAIERQPLAS
ncbi:hypothetical protein [Silvibacterium sp.]|uniref:hypothetical protein n=1 Tax=Silvibacterium sp. TaxID=1964179 RepID=UPI0039E55D5D